MSFIKSDLMVLACRAIIYKPRFLRTKDTYWRQVTASRYVARPHTCIAGEDYSALNHLRDVDFEKQKYVSFNSFFSCTGIYTLHHCYLCLRKFVWKHSGNMWPRLTLL